MDEISGMGGFFWSPNFFAFLIESFSKKYNLVQRIKDLSLFVFITVLQLFSYQIYSQGKIVRVEVAHS